MLYKWPFSNVQKVRQVVHFKVQMIRESIPGWRRPRRF